MTRWVWLLAVVLLLGDGRKIWAAEFLLEKVTLETKATEDEALRTKLRLDAYANWDWIVMDWTNGLTFPEAAENYHSVGVTWGFPKLPFGLEVDWDYQWDTRYEVTSGGIGYYWKPIKGLKVQAVLEAGSKAAAIAASERYRNQWDYQKLQGNYDRHHWSFKWRLERTAKDYPEAKYYTSTRYVLEQSVVRTVTPGLKVGLSYQESTGDYPEDTSLTRDYWKEKWSVWTSYRQGRNQRWDGSFSVLTWEKGIDSFFEPYQQNQYLTLEYTRWSKLWRVNARLSGSELNYRSDSVIFDPDEADLEEDTKSRLEQKLVLELIRRFNRLKLETEFFAIVKEYHMGQNDRRSGCLAMITWELRRTKIHLTMAPLGNGQSEKRFYELKWEYNPKKVIERL